MKIHGWCTRCRKVKRVTVSANALARAGTQGATGICDSCQQQEDDARRSASPRQLDLGDAPAQPPRGTR